MANKKFKRTTMDGTDINYSTLMSFLKDATDDLNSQGKEDAAHYFEMFHEWLENHYTPSKSFLYNSRILGL